MKIKYVQLESSAFLTDLDFIAMTLEEKGLYCTLILYLYSNNGKCELDIPVLSRLCNCKNIKTFEKIWQNVSKKFQARSGIIKHKRVTKELRTAKKFRQAKSRAGLKGAEKRWPNHNTAVAKVRKGNVNEKGSKSSLNSNTSEQSLPSSTSVRPHLQYSNTSEQSLPSSTSARPHLQALNFNSALTSIIKPRSQSDRTCFHNITGWLMAGCATGQFNNEIFGRVLDYAREASAGRNPAAVFMALLKKELNYRPKQRGA